MVKLKEREKYLPSENDILVQIREFIKKRWVDDHLFSLFLIPGSLLKRQKVRLCL